jgi:hypothetical protein
MLTCDLLSALSHGQCLESLTFMGENDEHEMIDVVHLQRFLDVTSKPFPYLTRLGLFVDEEAVPLIPQCFPTVTWLRLKICSDRRDESILRPIANMSQLQFLEILGDEDTRDDSLPAIAFVPLGSLIRLRVLNIGTSFFPLYVSEDDVEGNEWLDHDNIDKFTRADASEMFSRLTALEHLAIYVGDLDELPGHLFDSVSKHCPHLSSIELAGRLDLRNLVRAHAPVLENVRQLTINNVSPDIIASQAARLIDNFAPKLEKLRFVGENSCTRDVHAAWASFRSTQEFYSYGKRPGMEDLILGHDFYP